MPSLKTNYIRTDILSQCYRYELEVISSQTVDPKYYPEIEGYFQSINSHIVFAFPFIYSVDEMPHLQGFNFMLSNGCKIQIVPLLNNTITLNSKDIPTEIHTQIVKLTNFLYSPVLNIALNPFQQTKLNYNTTIMPGFTISTDVNNNIIGFYLVPIQAKITSFHSLSSLHQNSIILDYDSGTFYQKSSIVRYDKSNEILHFRTGQQLKKDSLKSMQILPVTGFQLAVKVSNYYKRIRQSAKLKEFIQKWDIKFDSRFMEIPYNFFPTSNILLGNKEQKSLGQLIGSISAYNFQYHFRKLFSNTTFDDSFRGNLYFILPQIYKPSEEEQSLDIEGDKVDFYNQLVQQEEQFLLPIITEFQNIKTRMKLNDCTITVIRYDLFVGWVHATNKTLTQISQIVTKQSQTSGDKVFILSNIEDLLRQEKSLLVGSHWNPEQQNSQPIYKQIINFFVQKGIYYHLINGKDNDFMKSSDVVAVKSLATIFTKLRLNPWKIKDIPFGTKPLMAFSLHVKHQTNGSLTVTVVASLNAFLSKYTCLTIKCTRQKLIQTVIKVIIESMQRFKSIHTVFPKRAMIFRRGDLVGDCELQFKEVEMRIMQELGCKTTYILLSSESPLRVYNQIDFNYISKDTVKPTQLLCQLKYNNERYIQLETEWPLHKIKILGIDTQEHNFEQKVIQLTTKLCFTYQIMSQVKFAKSLGFISYGQKLYQWLIQFPNIQGVQALLKQGLLMFL